MATPPDWGSIGKGVPLYLLSGIDRAGFQQSVNTPGSVAYQAVQAFGSLDAYKQAVQKYNTLYAKYQADFLADKVEEAKDNPTYTETALDALIERADIAQTNLENLTAQIEEEKQQPAKDREIRYNTVRSELENQYNNLVQLDPNAAYKGRASDLPAIFNQQAAQLADAGVTSITNLKIQDGKLVDSSTGKTVSTSNLGGQVAVDRDTGVQKWGDIFSGVKGGANYGITQAEDGSVILFPAWEKSKSLMQQVVQSDLFKVGSLALAAYGLYNLGTTLASAGGAEALTAAGSAATSTAVPGSFQAVLPELGVQTAATTAGATAVPGSFAAALPGLVAPVGVLDLPSYGLLDETTFPTEGITAGGGYSKITVVPPATPGLPATVAGLDVPSLSAMGGGTGLTVPVTGGTVSEMGFVPTGATPALGDPSSFINDPNLLYGDTPGAVISEDYLSTNLPAAASGLSVQDALRTARLASSLFGQQPQAYQSGYRGGGQVAGVDASGLLGLLQGKAGVPGVSPLIAPVASPVVSPYEPLLGQQPQYQSLLGRTQQSLLG